MESTGLCLLHHLKIARALLFKANLKRESSLQRIQLPTRAILATFSNGNKLSAERVTIVFGMPGTRFTTKPLTQRVPFRFHACGVRSTSGPRAFLGFLEKQPLDVAEYSIDVTRPHTK